LPFIRYTRDKRGYESTFVMHVYRAGTGASRTRVLYVFRSPSSLKVGRRAVEAEVREALEHTHPDLTFDWDALLREPASPRPDSRERPQRSGRPSRPEPAAPPVIEDESLLGRTVGASAAARLRGRYNDLMQRIGRRARTPEERDRLTERLLRLNPDDWPDAAAVQAGAASADAEWDALATELPQRRRGRRGGRMREDGRPGRGPVLDQGPDEASGIISGEGDPNDNGRDQRDTGPVGQGDDISRAGDGRGVGSEPGPSDAAGAGADPPDLQGRDGDHLD
jgi:hypothetical protein